MVLKWGMSEKIGLRTHKKKYLGALNVNEWGHSVGNEIDEEIKRIVQVMFYFDSKIIILCGRPFALFLLSNNFSWNTLND